MNLSVHLDGPLVVGIDGRDWHLPRFYVEDFADWQAEEEARRRAEALRGLGAAERMAILKHLDDGGLDLEDLRDRVWQPSGIQRVLSVCFAKAALNTDTLKGVPPADLDRARRETAPVIRRIGALDAKVLAVSLSGVIDPTRALLAARDGAEGEQGADPTAVGPTPSGSSGTDSPGGGGTGASTSPGSTTATPGLTPAA